ncbi:MAG: heavy-metal-associated domain-containing protein [Anaerolineaceae bacterium]|nr:heavy-metal-associated domain-containing protein [Anaerolineaceae bacterium]
METKTYSIPNINCNHCVMTINNAIQALDGVDYAEADLATKKLTVDFESPASDELIRETLASVNFPAAE